MKGNPNSIAQHEMQTALLAAAHIVIIILRQQIINGDTAIAIDIPAGPLAGLSTRDGRLQLDRVAEMAGPTPL